MAKSKRPWHICDDCLEPIAEHLNVLLTRMSQLGGFVLPAEFEGVLTHNHFAFGITWIKICVSVEFAEQVERAITRPVRRFHKLHYEASDRVGRTSGGYVQDIAIDRAIRLDWDMWLQSHPQYADSDERPESATEQRFDAIRADIQKAISFLRHTSPILRALIERRGVKLKEIPPTANEQQPTIPDGHRTVAMNGVTAACIWKGIDPKKANKRERGKARAAFLRALPTIPHAREGKRYVLNSTLLPSKSLKFLENL